MSKRSEQFASKMRNITTEINSQLGAVEKISLNMMGRGLHKSYRKYLSANIGANMSKRDMLCMLISENKVTFWGESESGVEFAEVKRPTSDLPDALITGLKEQEIDLLNMQGGKILCTYGGNNNLSIYVNE